jgi:hypothetical protein
MALFVVFTVQLLCKGRRVQDREEEEDDKAATL